MRLFGVVNASTDSLNEDSIVVGADGARARAELGLEPGPVALAQPIAFFQAVPDEVAALLSMDNRLTRTFDADGWSPLHLAAHYGHADTVNLDLRGLSFCDTRGCQILLLFKRQAWLSGRATTFHGAVPTVRKVLNLLAPDEGFDFA